MINCHLALIIKSFCAFLPPGGRRRTSRQAMSRGEGRAIHLLAFQPVVQDRAGALPVQYKPLADYFRGSYGKREKFSDAWR